MLALALYLECKDRLPGPSDARVVALSIRLRALLIHPASGRRSTFRNPDGVSFKLQNLRSVATGKGLANVSRMDREVWEAYVQDPEASLQEINLLKSSRHSGG